MLTRISIRNLVIVRELDLELGTGMTALTGETGAGKSILLDAVGLALGDKADTGLIRHGTERAEVVVEFDLSALPAIQAWLEQHDMASDGECLIRRVVVREGRSRGYINATPAPQSLLRELGELLIDLHGQHAHQSLLRGTAQRQLLDAFAGQRDTLRDTARLFQDWRKSRDALAALKQAGDARGTRMDYLQFQIDELQQTLGDMGALQEIEQEHNRLAHAQRLLEDTGRALALIHDDEPSLQQSLRRTEQLLANLSGLDPALVEACDLIRSAAIQLDEAASMLRHYQSGVEPDPQRLADIDAQLGHLHDLARKHRVGAASLPGLMQDLQQEMEQLANLDSQMAQLERQVEMQYHDFLQAATRLSAARTAAAETLSARVTGFMQDLGMRSGLFVAQCYADPHSAGAHGIDQVVFLVAANPGQPPAPLADVASGGELSRISLAIQVATADCGTVPTLIFDEVDVGIGGAVAEIVGQLLRRVGDKRQVLCVTHLAQVACQAHRQLRVEKRLGEDSTETLFCTLDAAQRVAEIARMLGGVEITEQTLRHAREMIDKALDKPAPGPTP